MKLMLKVPGSFILRENLDITITKKYFNASCKPYKSKEYIFAALFYFFTLFLSILTIYFYKTVYHFLNTTSTFFSILIVIIIILILWYAFNCLHLVFSIIKKTLRWNYILNEDFTISNSKFIYSNNLNLGKRVSWDFQHVKWLYVEFNKAHEEFKGIPVIVPNYTPVIILRNQNDEVIDKIMYSIREEDTQMLYLKLKDFLLYNGNYFIEYDVNYKDTITKVNHRGKKIKFISAFEFYRKNRELFSDEQLIMLDNLNGKTYYFEEEFKKTLISFVENNKHDFTPN